MQGDSKPDLGRILGKFQNLRNQSACRESDVPGPYAQPLWGKNLIESRLHCTQVGQWLAHPHEDKVIDSSARLLPGHEDLTNDFASRKVSLETVQTACAELATQGASNLCRNA